MSVSRSERQMDVDGDDTKDELAEEHAEEQDEEHDGDRSAVATRGRICAALVRVINGPGLLLLLLVSRSWSRRDIRSHTYLDSGDLMGWSVVKSKSHRLDASRTCFFNCVSTMLRSEKREIQK